MLCSCFVAGALINAIAFVGGSYFAKYLSEDQNIAKRRRRDMISLWRSIRRSLRSIKLLDWIAANDRVKAQEKHYFADTD